MTDSRAKQTGRTRRSLPSLASRIRSVAARQNRAHDSDLPSRREKRAALERSAIPVPIFSLPPELPTRVCVLDVETRKTSFKRPESSDIAIVGVMIFQLSGDGYISKGYRSYSSENLQALSRFVKDFDGIIIGHNIFEFDYRVLRQRIDLQGVIEKTVDTLAFLWLKKGRQSGGLSLRNLSDLNLRGSKGDLSHRVGTIWDNGQRNVVIRYNRNDCRLTMNLWLHLLLKRHIHLTHETHRSGPLRIDTHDLPVLLGRSRLFTYKKWVTKIERSGYVWKCDSAAPFLEVIDPKISTSDQIIFLRLRCDRCPRYFIFTTRNGRTIKCSESINCPSCDHPAPLVSDCTDDSEASLRAAQRCTVVRYLGDSPKFMACGAGFWVPQESYVDPEKARRFISGRARRYWERWMPIETQSGGRSSRKVQERPRKTSKSSTD